MPERAKNLQTLKPEEDNTELPKDEPTPKANTSKLNETQKYFSMLFFALLQIVYSLKYVPNTSPTGKEMKYAIRFL